MSQSLYELGQYIGWLPKDSSFSMTGSFDNPAGLSACLCAGLPFALYFIKSKKAAIKSFGTPFYIEKDSANPKSYSIYYFRTDTKKRQDIIITRKFPRKTNMIKIADNLIGSTFTGANKRDFSDAKIIYTITTSPIPYYKIS